LPETGPRLCATAYQHQAAFFQLPASRPYDNFLKAAGCRFMVEKDGDSHIVKRRE
jgi:hypothetical protein